MSFICPVNTKWLGTITTSFKVNIIRWNTAWSGLLAYDSLLNDIVHGLSWKPLLVYSGRENRTCEKYWVWNVEIFYCDIMVVKIVILVLLFIGLLLYAKGAIRTVVYWILWLYWEGIIHVMVDTRGATLSSIHHILHCHILNIRIAFR